MARIKVLSAGAVEGPVTELNHAARSAAANTFARTIALFFMSNPFVRVPEDTGS